MGNIYQDLGGLKNLAKALGDKHRVRIGIFGNKNSRDKAVATNAELGAVHEFGSKSRNIPARSFLRMPITLHQKRIVKLASKRVMELLAKGQIVKFWEDLGRVATNVIQQAFASSGFGSWAPNKPATVRAKGSSRPLIDTGQLRRAILWKVI